MSKAQFEAIKRVLKAIPSKEVGAPKIPVDTFLQEAFDLYEWSKEDTDALYAAGLEDGLLEDLLVRARALQYIQALWNKERLSRGPARQALEKQLPKAHALKNDLEAAFRFAFRKHPRLLNKVQQIEKGSTEANMIQDLNDLAVLGRSQLPLLEAIGFDIEKLHQSADLCRTISRLRAEVNSARKSNQTKDLRDRAYSHLKTAVDEVRTTGRYVFRNKEERGLGYRHRYLARK